MDEEDAASRALRRCFRFKIFGFTVAFIGEWCMTTVIPIGLWEKLSKNSFLKSNTVRTCLRVG